MAFATAEDVATRLGRELTSAEEALVEQVIGYLTGLIAEAADRDLDWATALDPVPATLTAICIEKALAIGSNPNQVAAHSEQLGAYREDKTFRGSATGSDLFLTPEEQLMVRLVVNGVQVG